MPHSEKLLQRETLGKNRVFTHERWHVRLENGRTAEREIIRHPGGVGIVAVDENGRLLMVRQYRSGMGCEALEIPAGKRDPGETPEQCGRRELEEECGFIAGRLEPLAAADAPILETALHRLAAPVRDPEEKYIRLLAQLVQQGSGAVQLTGKVRFCAADGVLRQETQAESAGWDADAAAAFTAALQAGKPARMPLPGGKTLTARVFPADFEEKIQVVHKKDLKNQADYARITTLYAGLVLRTRQPGDVYRPAGRAVHNRLRKWMNEADIPAQQRDTLPLLAAGSEVLWVCGSGFAEGLAPDETTTQILQMEQET